jgi:hypothetical protein
MRIGTWNLAGRWSPQHERFLLEKDCDVWLLTEVSERVALPGFSAHLGTDRMAPRRRWAGVFATGRLDPLPDPHPASAMATSDGLTLCSSILPWRGCGGRAPWLAGRHVDKTEHALDALLARLPTGGLVWGGDWNHALSGREYAGSQGGRTALLRAVETLALEVPTADLPHQLEGLLSIDHIAVPAHVDVKTADHWTASIDSARLSDLDAYGVEVGSLR